MKVKAKLARVPAFVDASADPELRQPVGRARSERYGTEEQRLSVRLARRFPRRSSLGRQRILWPFPQMFTVPSTGQVVAMNRTVFCCIPDRLSGDRGENLGPGSLVQPLVRRDEVDGRVVIRARILHAKGPHAICVVRAHGIQRGMIDAATLREYRCRLWFVCAAEDVKAMPARDLACAKGTVEVSKEDGVVTAQPQSVNRMTEEPAWSLDDPLGRASSACLGRADRQRQAAFWSLVAEKPQQQTLRLHRLRGVEL